MAVLSGNVRLRVVELRRSRILSIATSILSTQVVTSLLGLVYWTVAARGLSPSVVGQLGSATAAGMLLGMLGVFGLGTLLISRLRTLPLRERRIFLITALMINLSGGGLFGALFGVAAWQLLESFHFLSPAGPAFWWLVITSALTATGGVFDQVMLILGKPMMQVVRNTVSSGTKVTVLAGMLLIGLHSLSYAMAAWSIGQLIACTMAFIAAMRLLPAGDSDTVTVAGIRAMILRFWREALTHYGTNLSLATPSMLLPVIIAAVISAEANATFTTVRLVGTMTFVAPYAIAMALFATSDATSSDFEQRSQRVFAASLALSLGLYLVVLIAAPLILGLFGHTYAIHGAHYLRIMVLASPLLVFKDQYIARSRARRDLARTMPYVVAATVFEVGGTMVGAIVADLNGALLGWLIALGVGAIWVSLRWRHEIRSQH